MYRSRYYPTTATAHKKQPKQPLPQCPRGRQPNNFDKLSEQLSERFKGTLVRKINSVGDSKGCLKKVPPKSRVEFAAIGNKTVDCRPKQEKCAGCENIEPDELDTQSIQPFSEVEVLTNAKFSENRFESLSRVPFKKSGTSSSHMNYRDDFAIDLSDMMEEVDIKVNNVFKFPSYQVNKFHSRRRRK